MFSSRIISRVARAATRPTIARSFVAPRSTVLPTIARQPQLASFSTSIKAFRPNNGGVDEELALKLQSELELEKEMKLDMDGGEVPLTIKEFVDNSPFKIVDKPGAEQVQLVRKFGDETITVMFSIADINNVEDAMEDNIYEDEHSSDAGVPSSSAQSGGAQSINAKEERAAEEEYDEEMEELDESFPARVQVTIEKPNQGALQIECMAQDGMIVIDNVFYLKSGALATANSAEADWERRGIYAGPQFANLDEDLQVLIERYLDERGVNTSLALFVPNYIDYKEQKEYLGWLENVKGFVEA